MDNIRAAAILVEMFGQLTKLEDHRGCVVPPEYAEATSVAIMALKKEHD